MRKNLKDFRENHGDTARVVLFQLAAVAADCFLLWPRRDANPAKIAMNGMYALLAHGLAYKAAKYLETPKAQPKAKEAEVVKDNKTSETEEETNTLVRSATP